MNKARAEPQSVRQQLRNWAGEFRGALANYPRALRLMWECSPRGMMGYIALTLVTAPVPALQLWLSKRILDEVVRIVEGKRPADAAQARAVLLLIGLQVLIWVGSDAVGSLREFAGERFGARVVLLFSRLIYRKGAVLDLAFYESPAFFNQMENALRNSGWRVERVIRTLGWMAQQLITLGTIAVLLYGLHPLAPAAIIVLSLGRVFLAMHYARSGHKRNTRRSTERRMASYLTHLLGWRDAVKEIRLFGLHDILLDRHDALQQKFLQEDLSFSRSRHAAQITLELLATIGVAGVWAAAVLQAIARQITIGDMGMYFQAARRLRDSLGSVISAAGRIFEDGLALGTLFEFLDLDPLSVEGALVRGPAGGSSREVRWPIREGIEFRNVSFRYPGTSDWVLRDLSFTVQPGERVAIVGNNGAGKTTLVKLITRLYDPVDGEVYLDGRELPEYNLEDLRRQFGVIFQDFVRYLLSIRDNIGFGQVELLDDLARITQAAEKSGSLARIEALPRQFDTMLGRTYEDGADLSGGEWQKIALARAFMRDAQILILDEPTASLDPLAEEGVFKRFGELTEGKTSIIISHRFSTVRSADRVLVLQDGRLIEQGSHEKLMAMDGAYARMYRAQAERYR